MSRLSPVYVGLAALAAVATASAAPQPAPVKDVVDRVIARERIQTDLPNAQPEDPGWGLGLPRQAGELVLWGGVAIGALVIAYSLRDSLPTWSRSRRIEQGVEADVASARDAAMSSARLEADDLARAGRYGEAMHVLLLRALSELRERLKVSFADSLTSREIVRRAPLDAAGRERFSSMVKAVERVVFGDEGGDENAYFACRANFEALRRALGSERLR